MRLDLNDVPMVLICLGGHCLAQLKMLLRTLWINEPRCRQGVLGGQGAAGKSSWRGAALEEPTYLRAFGAFLARSRR
jgi:hypothetical protein